MILFYIGIALFTVIALIELSPMRFRNAKMFSREDRGSGIFLIVSSGLALIASITDNLLGLLQYQIWNVSLFQLSGIIIVIAGFIIRSTAIRKLGRDFKYSVSIIKNKLQTTGLYKHIRHPSYLGLLLYSIGTALFFISKIGTILIVLVFVSIAYRIDVEEKFLAKTIGQEYLDYKERTWRIIPYLY